MFTDEVIKCVDCGREFPWEAREQEWYRDRGLQPPKRCKDCREKKRIRFGDDKKGRPNQDR